MTRDTGRRARRAALRIVTTYGVIAALWIFFSDAALLLIGGDTEWLVHLAQLKGFAFIIVTASILYVQIVRYVGRALGTESDLRMVQALLQQTTDAIFLKDCDLRYLLFNKAAGDFTDRRPADVIGRDDTFLFAEADARWLQASDREILYGGQVQTREERLESRDGMTRTYLVTKGPLHDDVGNLYGLFGVSRDISDRIAVEEQLIESETRMRSLFENMQEGFACCEMIFDVDGRPVDFVYRDVNPAFGRLTGLADVKGRRASDVIPGFADAHPELLATYGAVARGGPPESLDIEFTPLQRWFSLSIYCMGSPTFAVVFDNITERKRIEQALRETSQRLQLAIEAAGIGIWDWDIASGSVVLDARMDALYGQPGGAPSERGDWWMEVLHDDDRGRARDALQSALLGPSPLELRARVSHPDGKLHTLDITGSVIRDESGVAVRIIGICRDVTDALALEAQLREAQKMEAIGLLAGGVAHDFNNMLTVIIGYGELLQAGLDRHDPLQSHLADILTGAERAATLTHDLLAFGRRQIMRQAPVDVNRMLTGLKNLLSRLIGDDIVVEVLTAADDIVIEGDQNRLESVLMNLATNARDAIDHGGTLTLSVGTADVDARFALDHLDARPGSYAVITVSDTGRGMDAPILSRIFEPFFTTKEVGRGTGLGLAMVYGTIRQHEGFIEVHSTPGEGTSFELYLPLTKSAAAVSTTCVVPCLQRGTATILLVEDDPSVRMATRFMLTSLGYTVLEAANGIEAETVFEREASRIDLVVTDVSMPYRGGVELASLLRRRRPELKVLFVSGNESDALATETPDELHFLHKPLRREALANKLSQLLDNIPSPSICFSQV